MDVTLHSHTIPISRDKNRDSVYTCIKEIAPKSALFRGIARNFSGRSTVPPCKIFAYSDAYSAFDAYCLGSINIYKTHVACAKRMKIFNENFIKY